MMDIDAELIAFPRKLQASHLDYDHTCNDISNYVKALRQRKGDITSEQQQHLIKLSNVTIQYLSGRMQSDSGKFLEAIITLDNTFNIDSEIFKGREFNKNFFLNINKYFIKICDKYQQITDESEKQKEISQNCMEQGRKSQKINQTITFQLYSIFYLFVMLIYERSNHHLLNHLLFTPKLLNNFFSLELPKASKIQKLVGIILTYLVKSINMLQWGKSLKKFLLNHIRLVQDYKVEFYFFYCLRTIKDKLRLADANKYQLITFLVHCLEKHSGTQQAFYIYDLLSTLVKKYPILGYQLLNMNIINYLEKDLLRHQNQIFKLFELLGMCIPAKSKEKSLNTHFLRLTQPCQKSRSLSIRIVTLLFPEATDEQCLTFIQSNILKLTLQSPNIASKYQNLVLSFLSSIHDRLMRFNKDIAVLVFQKLKFNVNEDCLTTKIKEFINKKLEKYENDTFCIY